MNLLVNVLGKYLAGLCRRTGRYARELALILSGVVLTGFMSLGVSELFAGGQSVVYAVSGDAVSDGNELQAGLMGVVNGVASMEEYYRAGQSRDVANANEEILVGTKSVKRNEMNRKAFSEGVQKAGAVGRSALETVTENQMSYNDYYTLLQIVEAEATGGDIPSKLLVANVVLNRVKDSHFPDTVYDVVWQRVGGSAQFSPTEDGRIDSCTITNSTIEAVELALQGEDNSQGALFFVARDSASPSNVQWFDSSLVWLFEYGGHEYYTFREYCE